MTSDEFEQKIRGIVKSYFPNAKYFEPKEFDIGFVGGFADASAEPQEKFDSYPFLSAIELEDSESAMLHVANQVRHLRFLKEPRFVFWRVIGVDSKCSFDTGIITFHACARFTLGY